MKADTLVKQDVDAELRWDPELDETDIATKVQDGIVTLSGFARNHYEKHLAQAMRRVPGVAGIRNSIQVGPRAAATDIKHKIEDAFRRNAAIDADQITVDARGAEVTLRGEVHSWEERDQAQESAWSAPGVTNVINELQVRV
jgi:osmotically-inducible protein OsmY